MRAPRYMETDETNRFRELARKWMNGTITPEEAQEYADWYNQLDDRPLEVPAGFAAGPEQQEARILQSIRGQAPLTVPFHTRSARTTRIARIASVAAILCLLAGGSYWWLFRHSGQQVQVAGKSPAHDVAPGYNKAVLILSDGSRINLDSAANGALAQQGNSRVLKLDSGHLAYHSSEEKPEAALYNTLTTPQGGQYQLTLPDGTRVWLNAASSIRFPLRFTTGSRVVEITGEAYFEVQKDPTRPFLVKTGGVNVRVLGTRFDINTYADEPAATTTLLDGSVQVGSSVLRPGQQARVKPDGMINIVDDSDAEAAVAWKNGFFQFDHTNLPAVMRQLSRWYDVDVRYEGAVPDRTFGGKISRSSNASEVLKILEISKVHFAIENKTIVVMP